MSLLRISKGMSLVEVFIAICITAVAVMAIFSLQVPAFQTGAKSDYLGRAAEIMQMQLESTEAYLMNPNCLNANVNTGIPAIPALGGSTTATYNVFSSGLSAPINGDATYSVSTTITSVPPTTKLFSVVVKITWSLKPTGISQTIYVSRQVFFGGPCT